MEVSYNVHRPGDFAVSVGDAELPSLADKVKKTIDIGRAVEAYQRRVVGTIYATPESHTGVEIANVKDGEAHVAFTFADDQGYQMLVEIAKVLGINPPQPPEQKPH